VLRSHERRQHVRCAERLLARKGVGAGAARAAAALRAALLRPAVASVAAVVTALGHPEGLNSSELLHHPSKLSGARRRQETTVWDTLDIIVTNVVA